MAKRVAAINDLSGLGRCSLTAAISVLSALGLQACPLPTAVLSAQTGFPGYILRDLEQDLESFPAHWQGLGLDFQGIYSGFLANYRQVGRVLDFLDGFGGHGVLTLVDPVLGDGGSPYAFCTPELTGQMAKLAAQADILTPNLTEAYLLTGKAYHKNAGVESAKILARQLQDMGAKNVVVTGVPDGEFLCNVVRAGADDFVLRSRRQPGSFSGTGDLFASVVCGACLQGCTVEQAAALAVKFLTAALADTPPAADTRQGVEFEQNLYILTEEAKKWRRSSV